MRNLKIISLEQKALYITLVIVILIIILFSYKFFSYEREELIKSYRGLMASTSSLKALYINHWFDENEALLKLISNSNKLVINLSNYLKTNNPQLKNKVFDFLVETREKYNYEDLIITDITGSLILSS